jgi:hypothetical protein
MKGALFIALLAMALIVWGPKILWGLGFYQ